MADLFLTDSDRITVLEQQLKILLGRVAALEAREAQREGKEAGLSTSDANYLSQQIFGAVEGGKQAESLEHFQ